MGCPGGCITGGGQPRPQEDINIVRQKRMEAIYGEDERKIVRKSHENQSLMNFYKEWGRREGPLAAMLPTSTCTPTTSNVVSTMS